MQSYLKLHYDVINVMLLSDDVTYQFVLSSVVSKHLLLALSVLCLFVELTMCKAALATLTSVVPRSRFLGDTGVPLPEFQGDIYKFWGTHQIFQIFTC